MTGVLQSTGAVLETERLRLRQLVAEDVDSLFTIWGDGETMRYYPRPYSRSEVEELIERQRRRYREDGYGLWAVVLKGSGEVLGDCGLVRQEVEGKSEIEVGYHFRRDSWGHGYATEAARAAVEYGFRTFGPARIIALVRPENVPSRRVAERLGMKVDRQVTWAGMPHDIFAVSREAYGQAKE
ncbi:MAG: GNAT family N-acetyltransferase [Acidobacteria bacterium]|nr:GNAT family N-acetyltransferase [Acidobacteriota bacterium]